MRDFKRSIFFTKTPIKGYYRYKDVFQIFPCNLEDTPSSKYQKHFPNILEYWIEPDEIINFAKDFDELNNLVNFTGTSILKQDKYLSLLTAFTNNHFFRYFDTTGSWGMPMLKDDPGKEANTWSSKWCLPLFHSPDLAEQLRIENFSNQDLPEIERLEDKVYFMQNPNLDNDSKIPITFPKSIDNIFNSYFSLNPNELKFVDPAIDFNLAAVELKDIRKTLSLLSSFTAVETMIELEYMHKSVERCSTCGQLKYSISRKFREYLLKYIGNTENNKKKFNSFYSIRSKIAHTGQQLFTERLFSDVPKDIGEKEFITRLEILQMGRLAIYNWLHDK